MNKRLSVILPTYNEKENIEELIRQIYQYVGADLYEIVVVDDDSPDKTWEIVQNLQKEFDKLRLIRRINERGLPSAIWRGVQEAKGDTISWMDCDFSHHPKEIPKLLEYIPEYDLVVASRFAKGGKDKRGFKRVFVSKAFSIITNLFLWTGVKDVISGYFVVKKKVFDDIELMTTGYAEYCIRFVCQVKRKGYKIKEIGYVTEDRTKGESKTDADFSRSVKHGYLCLKEILRLFFRRK